MSVQLTDEEKREALDFLRQFVAVQEDPFQVGDPLPLRVTPLLVSSDELEGECIEWCLQYLSKSNAPECVIALITHTATKQITEGDLSLYRPDKSDDSLLDASKLAVDVLNKVREVCKFWSSEPPCFYQSKMQYECCVHAIKNTRRKMEDKHVLLPQFNNLFGFPQDYTNQAFFAVYDGHGGGDASIYASTQLHCHLARNKNIETDPKLALHQAFQETDECFVKKAKREGLRSGSTGVAVLIKGDTLYVGWLGDSQVVLCKGGQVTILMDPHKPDREDERQRIEVLGGCVVWFGAWRVNGSLSVSRAIGDAEHKPYISGEPDIMEFNLEGDEDFLVLACDGLWDVVKPQDAVDSVIQHLADGKEKSSAAKMLVDKAKNLGSSDNISVVVVFLDPHKRDVPARTDVVNIPDVVWDQNKLQSASEGIKDTVSMDESQSVIISTPSSHGEPESSHVHNKTDLQTGEGGSHVSSVCAVNCAENYTNGHLQSDRATKTSPSSSPELSPKSYCAQFSSNPPKTDKSNSRKGGSPKVKDSQNSLDIKESSRVRSRSAPPSSPTT